MKLFLMRHAHADEGAEMDPTRELNDQGIVACSFIKQFLKDAGYSLDVVFTSDFKRAVDTAENAIPHLKSLPWYQLPELRPDGEPETAWNAMRAKFEWSDDSHVFVVTHNPFINKLAASVFFGFSPDHNAFAHASVLRITTHKLPPDKHPLHWMIRPSLIDRMKDQEMIEAGRNVIESLNRLDKASVVNPLIKRLQQAVAGRFSRQLRAIKQGKSARRFVDGVFNRVWNSQTDKAYNAGAAHVGRSLAVLKEAKYTTRKQPPGYVVRPSEVENDINETTSERVDEIRAYGLARGLTSAAITAAIAAQFKDWKGQRSETIATHEISRAFHTGGSDVAAIVNEEGRGSYVTKLWATEDDPCETCEENEAAGPLSEDEQFPSGDAYPPAHPNCRCSIEYGTASN